MHEFTPKFLLRQEFDASSSQLSLKFLVE